MSGGEWVALIVTDVAIVAFAWWVGARLGPWLTDRRWERSSNDQKEGK